MMRTCKCNGIECQGYLPSGIQMCLCTNVQDSGLTADRNIAAALFLTPSITQSSQ